MLLNLSVSFKVTRMYMITSCEGAIFEKYTVIYMQTELLASNTVRVHTTISHWARDDKIVLQSTTDLFYSLKVLNTL